jgi:hypothetical protein
LRVLGVELSNAGSEYTLVLLDDDGRVAREQRVGTLPAVAAAVGQLVGDEPFLLGVDVPVVVPDKPARSRSVESLVRRRFGLRLPPGGRTALGAGPLGVAGEALLAGLATAGFPCLPFPDRDGRKSGLAETHPGLILKALLWESTAIAGDQDQTRRENLFRAYAAPVYRAARLPARTGWADQATTLDLLLRAVGVVDGYDLQPSRDALSRAGAREEVERAAALFDATLIAGTSRRYLDSPEQSLFLGDREAGYVILPADGLIRRLGAAETSLRGGALFPKASLRERLGSSARLRAVDLVSVPGSPQRLEATFSDRPRYEFDNLDEMLWWKHCRHVAGPLLPTEGLCELAVTLDSPDGESSQPLRLVRSRHSTLSFRFDPPATWRSHIQTRDGKTYPFQVHRVVFETVPTAD